MFKNLMGFWKGKRFLDEVYDEFERMLEDAENMFHTACKRLHKGSKEADKRQEVRDSDKEINTLEKRIRQRIVEHMAIQPTVDVAACLMLMSIVKDGERIGDYCKNLYEAAEMLNEPVDEAEYTDYFGHLDDEIVDLFRQTRRAFFDADEEQAKLAWDMENKLAKRCDGIVKNLASAELSTNRAVCYVLVARHYKRIVAHLVNIATATILPLSEIDYFDEKRARKDRYGF